MTPDAAPESRNQRVIDLHKEGKSEAQISLAVGLTGAAVRRILTEAGIARPAHLTRASVRGENLADPARADKLSRKF